ncbi:hypothetical protein H4W33_009770 [Kibdelosporangium phytohabitans]|nr:hypothetical protein [Kibdelosporangium phytohabitans]
MTVSAARTLGFHCDQDGPVPLQVENQMQITRLR